MFEWHQHDDRAGIKVWNNHGELDFGYGAMEQLYNIAALPFIHKDVAGMPDVHVGIGGPVGCVIATDKAIVPATVGVDIGCGVIATLTSLTSDDLPDNMDMIRAVIEEAVPHGRTKDGKRGKDKGGWSDIPAKVYDTWFDKLADDYIDICHKHPGAIAKNTLNHLGTLGSGNHFIEICLDEQGRVWVMLHSGSRGPGNRIGVYFISEAKEEMERWHIDLKGNRDLAYLVENTELFDDYVEAVDWAQRFALLNRKIMMEMTLIALKSHVKPFSIYGEAINCHHNYVTRENHFGKNVWITRKGAVRARKGDLGIIPGSMGTGSFIVEGLGNPNSFHSCSHGAGRMMSRREAKETITLEQHATAMDGISARLDEGVLDESPAAYKDINAVIDAQTDLVKPLHHLRQIVNVKG